MILEINFTPYIPTTLLGLLGLIAGYLFFYFKNRSNNKLKELQLTNPADQIKALEMSLNELGITIDTSNLSTNEKFILIKKLLHTKTNRYLIVSVTSIILSGFVTFLIFNNFSKNEKPIVIVQTDPRKTIQNPPKPELKKESLNEKGSVKDTLPKPPILYPNPPIQHAQVINMEAKNWTYTCGYMGYDSITHLVGSQHQHAGGENISFFVKPKKAGSYKLEINGCSGNEVSIRIYLNAPIDRPPTTIYSSFTFPETGGFYPANLEWIAVPETILLASNKQTKITIMSVLPDSRYDGISIKSIRLTEVLD